MIDRPTEIEDVEDLNGALELAAARYEGFIDAIEDGRIFGWALNGDDPDHKLGIDIYFGSEKIGTVVADRYREDLIGYGDRSGKQAFVFTLPKALWAEDRGSFYACFAGTDVPLLRGPNCSRLQPVGAPPPRLEEPRADDFGEVAETGKEGTEPANFGAVLARVEACERALVTLLHLAHPGSDYEKRKAARSDELEVLIGTVREELGSLEGFILRHDERLKESEAILKRLDALEGRRRIGRVRALWGVAATILLVVGVAFYFLGSRI